GREGLDLATRWIAPAPGSRVEDAFRLYLDWNGTGGRLTGDSIRATSSDVDAVGAYAIERADGRRSFLLVNKDTRARHASVRLAPSRSAAGAACRSTQWRSRRTSPLPEASRTPPCAPTRRIRW